MLCLIVGKVAPSQFEIALPTFHKIVIFIQMAFFLEERKLSISPASVGAPDFRYRVALLNVDQVLLSLGGWCFRSVLSVDTPNSYLEL